MEVPEVNPERLVSKCVLGTSSFSITSDLAFSKANHERLPMAYRIRNSESRGFEARLPGGSNTWTAGLKKAKSYASHTSCYAFALVFYITVYRETLGIHKMLHLYAC